MFNASATASQIATALQTYGLPITVSTLGVSKGKAYGVFVASDQSNDNSTTTAQISNMTTDSKTCLLPGTMKKPPAVGDDITCSIGSFRIYEVIVTNPSGTPLLYKVLAS